MPDKVVTIYGIKSKPLIFHTQSNTYTLFWTDEELCRISNETFTHYKRLFSETWMEPEEGEYLCVECEFRREDYAYDDPDFGHHFLCPIKDSIIESKLDEFYGED